MTSAAPEIRSRNTGARWSPDVHASLRARGYLPDGEPFATGGPDRASLPLISASGLQVVAKLFPDGCGEACWKNMIELWASPFGERRQPPGLPRPVEYLPDIDALILERLPGRPLLEKGEPDEDAIDDAMRLVAGLHDSGAHPPRRRNAKRIVRSLERKTDRLRATAPALAVPISSVVDFLRSRPMRDSTLVPCHGDFSPRNVLVSPGRSALIDWDRFQLADPARDIAHFGAWCWAERVRRGEKPSWSVLDRAVTAYDALRPSARIRERLGFHVAAGLVRVSESLILHSPEDALVVPALAAEALRRLEAA